MAPATIAGAAQRARGGRAAGWDRESIIIAIQEWVATYGEPPRAADWNPSAARWADQLWRVERYRAGRCDGSPWPALNSAKRAFGGSLTAALRAAGHEPAKPGPRRRGGADEPERARRIGASPEARAVAAAAVARAQATEARTTAKRLAAKLERAEATIATLRSERAALAARPIGGPAGPAVLAEALRALAAARRSGNPVLLRDALRRVARAAAAWQERI